VNDDFPNDKPDLDMFGNPALPIRDRRGRPSFRKDKENQDFVAVRIAAGWSQKRIAENMGVDEKTLRKYFSRELELGAVFIEGVVLDVLLRRTREGHAPSVRQLREVSVEGRRREAERSAGIQPGATEQRERLGKKAIDEQRAAAADADLMAELESEAAHNARH
jgi:hypothetical protein